MKPWPILFCLFVGGCQGSGSDYFPLKSGAKWSYEVKTDFDSRVDDMTVARRVSVGPAKGYELDSPTGPSRLAWDRSTLLASQISGQTFEPPLPLIVPGSQSWRGTIETAGRRTPAKAQVKCQVVKLTFAGRQVDGLQSDVRIQSAGQPIQLTSWFVQGTGLVRQEQRTGDRRDRRIEYLSGP